MARKASQDASSPIRNVWVLHVTSAVTCNVSSTMLDIHVGVEVHSRTPPGEASLLQAQPETQMFPQHNRKRYLAIIIADGTRVTGSDSHT